MVSDVYKLQSLTKTDHYLISQYVEFYKFAHSLTYASDSTVSNKAGSTAELYNYILGLSETVLEIDRDRMEQLIKSLNLLNATRAEYRKLSNASVIKNKNKNEMMEDKTWVNINEIEKMIRIAYKVSGFST